MGDFKGLNKDEKKKAMKEAVQGVAESILSDHSGDEVMERVLVMDRTFHHYSFANTILIHLQTPNGTKRAASLTAWDEYAKKQGHEPSKVNTKKGKKDSYVVQRKGSSAIWIWGFRTWSKEVEKEDGTTDTQEGKYFPPVMVWACEDILYRDTQAPIELEDFVQEVPEAEEVFSKAMQFASSKGIAVQFTNIYGGARGVSKLGTIVLQEGDPVGKLLPILLHELGHELLHGEWERQNIPTQIKEAEAEAVSASVLKTLGMDTNVNISAAYLRNWKATPEVVLASMERIYKAVREIVEEL